MAKRLFAYLQSEPLLDQALSGDLLAQRARLLNGVLLGNVDKSWREKLTKEAGTLLPRALKDLHKDELPLQDAPKQQLGYLDKFTAEGVIKRSAWYDEKQVYSHQKTDWYTLQGRPQQPKYGYAYLSDPRQKPLEMKAVSGASTLPMATRYYRPIGLADMQAYLNSPQVQAARKAKKSCPYSFHDFLQKNGHPKALQAVCHDDLSTIKDWSFANFSGVDFSGAVVTGNLSGANFSDAYWVSVTAKTVWCHQDHPVNLSRAQLGFGDWRGAKLPKANMTQADCSLTNFSGAELTDIQSIGTAWYKTDLTGVTRQDLLAEQTKQVDEAQKKFRARMRELDGRVTVLEQELQPMLARLEALETQPDSAAVSRTEALEKQILALQTQIHEAANSQFKQSCEAELRELRERTDVLRSDVDQLKSQLQQLEVRFGDQVTVTLTLTTAGDVGRKLLVEQTAVQLTHRVKDLVFYLPPTVIETLPDKMTLDELMARLNATSQALSVPEVKGEHKREHKGKAVGKVASPSPTDATAPLPQRFDAVTVIDQFLTQDENLLLLLGEPGAGKSLSTWQAARRLINQFQPGMSGQQISQCWLPIHIELNKFSLSELTGLIDRQLKAYGLTDAAIAKLKQTTPDQTEEPRVLLMLDGYDELRQEADTHRRDHTDLFQRLGGAAWKAGQLKVLVTCRRNYLSDLGEERMMFGVGQSQRYQRYELLPFTLEQVQQYLTSRTIDDTGDLLEAEQYFQAIESADSLKRLVSNPFVLQLFLESLPRLMQGGQDITRLVRYDLYTAFFDQWIEREVRRLKPAQKVALGRDSDAALAEDFKRLACYLALSMYAQGMISVGFTEQTASAAISPEYAVWDAVLDQLDKEATTEYNALLQTQQKSEQKARFGAKPKPILEKELFMAQAKARADQLADLLPLSRSGNSYKFVHKSFYEYLVTASIVDLSGGDTAFQTAALALFQQRLVQNEPGIVNFIIELSAYAQHPCQPHKVYSALRRSLFDLIARSAKEPSLGQASSNAATLLNLCHEPLSHQSWLGVQLPGADLRYSVLAHSDLSQANLRGARLDHTVLYQAQLTGADLRAVSWGEFPRIALTRPVQAIAHHPTQPWLAVAIEQGNKILLVHRDSGKPLGKAFTGHTSGVESVAFSPDGTRLASGSWDKTIRLWDVARQAPLGEALTGHTYSVTSVVFSPDGTRLASASGREDRTVRLWDVARQAPLGEALTGHTDGVTSVAFSPDGTRLASGSDDRTVRLWDVVRQAPLGKALTGHRYSVTSVAFSPDGTRLASGSGDSTIRLWDAARQVPLGEPLTGHTGWLSSVAFSPDGTRLASGSSDNTIRLWDVARQVPLGEALTGHTKKVISVTFSPDGARLVSGSKDYTIRL